MRSVDPRDPWREELRARLAGLDARSTDDIVEELAGHLQERYQELLDSGADPAEARRLALDELAAPHVLARALRPVVPPPVPPAAAPGSPAPGGWPWSGLSRDVRDAFRALRASPGVTLVAILTLAIGIGANAAIFSVVNAAMLRPLPFAEPDRLVTFWGSAPQMGLPVVNYPDALFLYVHDRTRTLQSLAAFDARGVTLTTGTEAELLIGAAVTADFFRVLGRTPALGRTFSDEEHAPGSSRVAILSDGFWHRRFGGAPDVVGRTITLDGFSATVVGVMPPGFDFPSRAELWMPLPLNPESVNCWCYDTVGRLAPGQTTDTVAREMAGLHDDFFVEREGRARREAGSEPESIVIAQSLDRHLLGDVRTPLLVLSGAVAMVLLIACANIANLLLARANARAREMAVRLCLGASRWLIVRQLLVESLLLAATGASLGLAVGVAGARTLGRFAAERLSYVNDVGIEPAVVLFTIGVTLVTVVLFGVAPAIRGARVDLQAAIKDGGGRTTRGAASRRLTDTFVVAQFALSIVLLVGAGLLMRSLGNLLAVDPGFNPENVLVGRVSLAPGDRPVAERDQRTRLFYSQLAERVAALPGVRHVGLSSSAPFSSGDNQQIFTIRGREPAADEPRLVASVRGVTPGYFSAVGTPVRHGRVFEPTDSENAPLVAIVDETLARLFWPDGNAVGQFVRLGDDAWRTIVGVVASVKHGSLSADANRFVYLPHAQNPYRNMDLVVRADAAPGAQAAAIRQHIQAIDPSVPLYEVHTLQEAVDRSMTTERLTNVLLMAFAIAALLLAAIGIYGVIAVSVSQRIPELAIRLALGATPGTVARLVMRQGLALVLVGAAIGLAGAVGLSRYIATLLFGVTPTDPYVFVAVTGLLVAVAVAACLIPARRAMSVDPLTALRG